MVQGAVLALALLVGALVAAQIAFALPDAAPSPTPTRTFTWATVPSGADASWPSCTPPRGTKRLLPLAESPAFAVVGVNDGLPGTRSACIGRELRWADTATGGTARPRLEYYVMAADPWTEPELKWVPHPDWPSSNDVRGTAVEVPTAFASDAHSTTCTGGHDEQACAYVYGWRTARTDAALPGLRSPASTRFWIDVEAVRTWNDDQRFNQAVIEGMVAGFTQPRSAGGVGTTTGLYSDYAEWADIAGRLRTGSPLPRLDEWLAIGRTDREAAIRALRRDWPFVVGARVRIVQYLDGAIDRDVAAPR